MANYCPECGAATIGGRFCSGCGTELPSASVASPSPAQQGSAFPPAFFPEPERPSAFAVWWGRLNRAFSLRIGCSLAFAAIILGGIASLAWEPLGVVVFFVVFVGGWLIAVFNDAVVLNCPYCGKRVKLGAGTCHHCGRDVR